MMWKAPPKGSTNTKVFIYSSGVTTMNQKTKRCSKCGTEKMLSEFYKDLRYSGGVGCWCKQCHKEYTLKWNHKKGNTSPMDKNKACSQFLGIYVAERVLSKVFKNVTRTPLGHKGFDFVCGKGYKIDVKSATRRAKQNGAWQFNIRKNKIPDQFLLLAFNNRNDLEPEHVWLIPGEDINHLTCAWINESNLAKWDKYETRDKLNQVIKCCNIIRGESI